MMAVTGEWQDLSWREKSRQFGLASIRSVRRRWYLWLLLVVVPPVFGQYYTIGLNITPSLPYRLFLIEKSEMPGKGQYVAYRWHGGGPIPRGATMVKILAGHEGDVIRKIERDFYLNGAHVGYAKTHSRQGVPLEAGPVGVIPAGKLYVTAPHPDSLDSRYALTGWIKKEQLLGRAYAIF